MFCVLPVKVRKKIDNLVHNRGMSLVPVLLNQLLGFIQFIFARQNSSTTKTDRSVSDFPISNKLRGLPWIGYEEEVLEPPDESRLIVKRLVDVDSLQRTC